MSKKTHWSRGWALLGTLGLCLWAIPAHGLVVSVDIGWGYGLGWTAGNDNANLINNYNLQEGSIVQIIMYNSATHTNQAFLTEDPDWNFDYMGSYGGSNLSSEPYTSSNYPDTRDAYDPTTAPTGHVIAYQTQIGNSISNANGYWYYLYAQFEILGTYDRLYLRVFGATNLNQAVFASYWGLSTQMVGTNIVGTWYVPIGSLDNTVADQKNYFEVIPEPSALALFMLGGATMLAHRQRRRKTGRPC